LRGAGGLNQQEKANIWEVRRAKKTDITNSFLMNRIDKLFSEKTSGILSVYFTAGYPYLDSTTGIIKALQEEGADMVEIGIPFSDPMADGPVIQGSNDKALHNGMSLKLLFRQLSDIRKEVEIPLLLMGYLNPVIQFGIDNFCMECSLAGIDGVILPDLPPAVYMKEYVKIFDRNNLYNILLITPQSSAERIRYIDNISRGFIYMVSSAAVTGSKGSFSAEQTEYFKRVSNMKLNNRCLTGFGISNHETFGEACKYSAGGIIGSAFVKALGREGQLSDNIIQFMKEIKN
jgi:tryptophan synthase alpha chain